MSFEFSVKGMSVLHCINQLPWMRAQIWQTYVNSILLCIWISSQYLQNMPSPTSRW